MTTGSGVRQPRLAAAVARLRHDVEHGCFRDADMLPAERDLATRLAVSRTSLRRMLASLIDEGLLTHRQGVGTFVRPRRDKPASAGPARADAVALEPLAGFSAAVRRLGRSPSSRAALQTEGRLTAAEAMLMAMSPADAVIRLRRLRCIDGEPVALERAVLPAWALAPGPLVDDSLYAALAAAGCAPVRALHRLRPALGTADEASALGTPVGAPVMYVTRTDYLPDARCCALTVTVLRGDRFDLLLELRGGPPPFGLVAADLASTIG